jgi:hypothetical protein
MTKDINSINNHFLALISDQKWREAKEWLMNNQDRFDSSVLSYNYGLLQLKEGHFLEARINFENSKLNGFETPELQNHLGYVKEQLDLTRLESMYEYHDKFFLFLSSEFIYLPFFVLVLILFSIMIKNFKRITLFKFVGLFSSILILLTIPWYVHEQYRQTILTQETLLYDGPSLVFGDIQVLPKGLKVIRGKKIDNFYEVVAPRKIQGWIANENLHDLRENFKSPKLSFD